MRSTELVQWFRQSTPYVNMHRGKTFVIMLDGDTIASPNFINIISDIRLLHSLGIKLVIVYGARVQINQLLRQQQIEPQYHKNIRVTDLKTLDLVKQAVGKLNFDITSRLSMRTPHSPLLNVVSSNFILAQPIGVDDGVDYMLSGKLRRVEVENIKQQLERDAIVLIDIFYFYATKFSAQPIGVDDGVDYMLSGKLRRVEVENIKQQLERDAIVLIGPVAPSVTGESFNLPFEEIATQVAIKINAEKLIGFSATQGILDENNQTISDLLPQQAQSYLEQFIKENQYHSSQARFLQAAVDVCREGVKRSHLLSYEEDGSLLQELFTRDGVGTQLSMENSEDIRIATARDIPGLLDLIHPLEQQGILVKRSREQLEMDIEKYTIIDRDGIIIACAALNVYEPEKMAEMACVAVHPDYRSSSRGDILLEEIQKRAKAQGIEKLFVLTTRTVHWFQERGFRMANVEDLPAEKREHYNYQRRSKILIQDLVED